MLGLTLASMTTITYPMTGRFFGLIQRFPYITKISSSVTVFPFSIRRGFFIPFSSSNKQQQSQRLRSIIPLRVGRRREDYGFCTGATETKESHLSHVSVRIRCSKDVADAFSDALLCFGAGSVTLEEINSDNSYETWITSLFADGQDVHTCITLAAESIDLKCIPEFEVCKDEQCDWLKNIQETFSPVEITEGLWIVPKWRTPPVQSATNIILNPGMAFGTGEHPTTKLCLRLLRGLIKGGEKFLDYGTGSGVLAIAALKMGADAAVGIDVEPEAIASATENIALNEIEAGRMRVYLVPGEGGFSAELNFDIVIANLLLNPLLDLAEDIVSCGKPGAAVGLSGVLSEQIYQIKERFSVYLDDISVEELDGWASVHGVKRRSN